MKKNEISIAVAPFQDLSAGSDSGYFASGFTDDLRSELSRFQAFRVIAGQSVAALITSGRTIEDVVREWDLDHVVQGSVRRDRSSFRISVQLLEAAQCRILWADRFTCPTNELFEVQDEIVSTIASKLSVRIDQGRLGRTRKTSDSGLAAYDWFLRGMDCLNRGTLEGDEESRGFFQKALDIDERYSRAYAGLSLSYFNEWSCQAWHLWEESEKNAFDCAKKAVALDDTDAMVHAVLARVLRFRGEHEQAENRAAIALELNPNDANVLIQISLAKLFGGLLDEALSLAQRAIRSNPLHGDWYQGVEGWILFLQGDYERAYQQLQKGGDHIVNFGAYRAACRAAADDLQGAQDEFDHFVRQYCLKIAFGREADPGEAIRWAIQVEPFRSREHARRMPDLLQRAGIVDIDTDAAIASHEKPIIRPADVIQPAGNRFINDNGIWTVSYEGTGAQLVEVKGFHDIARLLERPGESIHCLELYGGVRTEAGAQEVLDDRALREYRDRIVELRAQLDDAELEENKAAIEPLQYELDFLTDELARSTGLGGRSRKMTDSEERARAAVTWRIRSAIKKIRVAHPRLGRHLSVCVRTGAFCEYLPETDISWEL